LTVEPLHLGRTVELDHEPDRRRLPGAPSRELAALWFGQHDERRPDRDLGVHQATVLPGYTEPFQGLEGALEEVDLRCPVRDQ
jgi:hypothetical protein